MKHQEPQDIINHEKNQILLIIGFLKTVNTQIVMNQLTEPFGYWLNNVLEVMETCWKH
jgi:hypothetical protein